MTEHQSVFMDVVALHVTKMHAPTMVLMALALVIVSIAAFYAVQWLLSVKRFLRRAAVLAPIPVAPCGNFALGHVLNLLQCYKNFKGPWDWIEEWLIAAGGSIVRWQLLGTHVVVIADPIALKRVLQVRQKVYEKDLDTAYSSFLPILGTGLVTSDGDLWQQQRLLIGPALRLDLLDYIIGIAKRATERLFVKLESERGTGRPVDMLEEFRLLTLQIIGEAVLSLPPEECDRSMGVKLSSALEQQLCYEIKTFLLAGHETSAAMLTWSLFELSKSPECLNKVLAEASTVFSSDAEPSRPEVDGMAYTLAVLKESLRKYSVVPVVTRSLAQDDELLGYKIPKGTMICIHIQAVHNKWKEPKTFSPDRFMPGGEYDQFDDSIQTYMFLPFVQGPRNCLGQHMALLEARVVLGMMVKKFKFRTAHADAGRRDPHVIPTAPHHGMMMLID